MRNLVQCLQVIFRNGAARERNIKCTGWCLSEAGRVGSEKLAAGIVQWVSASLIVKARARSSMVRASGS